MSKRNVFPLERWHLTRVIREKARTAPQSHSHLAALSAAPGAFVSGYDDIFQVVCRKHPGETRTVRFDKLIYGSTPQIGCERCRFDELRKLGRQPRYTFSDHVAKELKRGSSRFKLADETPRRVKYEEDVSVVCLLCESLNVSSILRCKLHNLLTDVRTKPGQVACRGPCDSALKGKALRLSKEEAEARLPPDWRIVPGTYVKHSGLVQLRHRCGRSFSGKMLNFTRAAPVCPACSGSVPSNSLRPLDPRCFAEWVSRRSENKLKLPNYETYADAGWSGSLELELTCVRHPYERIRLRASQVRSTGSAGCPQCLIIAQRRSKADSREDLFAAVNRRDVSSPERYLADTGMRPDSALTLFREQPMWAEGVMTVQAFQSLQAQKWSEQVIGYGSTGDKLRWLSSKTTLDIAAAALGISRSAAIGLQRSHGIEFATPAGWGKRVGRHDAFSDPIDLHANYWAGFIAADGNLRGSNIKICLHVRDEQHLQRFMRFISYRGHLSYSIKRPTSPTRSGERAAWGIYCECAFASSTCSEQLLNTWGVEPQKVFRPFDRLPSDESARAAFLCGIIDGDGCRAIHGALSIATVSPEAARALSGVADQVCAASGLPFDSAQVSQYGSCSSVRLSKRSSEIVRQRVIELALPCMSRKWVEANCD